MKFFRQFTSPLSSSFLQAWFSEEGEPIALKTEHIQSTKGNSSIFNNESQNSHSDNRGRSLPQSYHKLFQSHKMEHGKS
jgi:hypothetical protein